MKCDRCKREFYKPPYNEEFNAHFGYLIQTNGFKRQLLEKGLTYKDSKLKYKYSYRYYCAYCGKIVKDGC